MSSTHEELRAMLSGGPTLHAIAVAADLGIPDLLDGGPATTADLARATGSNEDALYRLLRALSSEGVFAERPGRRFALTPMSRLLRTDEPSSLRPFAVLAGERWRAGWYSLGESVRTGRPALELYDWLSTNPDAARRFEEAQSSKWATLGREVVEAYDFSGASCVVDVGGGSGLLLEAILEQAPDATGILVETPVIADEARKRLASAPRRRVVEGDFLEAVPGGGDVYVLAFVLHNWDDRPAARILRNCRRAMAGNGRVLVIESVVPTGRGPSTAKVHDLEMLVFMSGRERTHAEYRVLFEAASLRLGRVVPTGTSASLLVGKAA